MPHGLTPVFSVRDSYLTFNELNEHAEAYHDGDALVDCAWMGG